MTVQSFEQRQQDFRKVKTRIISILLDYPSGLPLNLIQEEYYLRFRHMAILDNRLRELRVEGEVQSLTREESKRLIWRLKEKEATP